MQITRSQIPQNILQFFQSNQDKQATAIDIVRAKYPDAEPTNPEVKWYASWLNEQVRKKNVSVQSSTKDIFGTNFYYLEEYQKLYWQRKNWSA